MIKELKKVLFENNQIRIEEIKSLGVRQLLTFSISKKKMNTFYLKKEKQL